MFVVLPGASMIIVFAGPARPTAWEVGLLMLGLASGGYFLVCFAWHVIAPPRLEISPSGIKLRFLWRIRQVGWAQAVHFRTVLYNRGTYVGFDYTDVLLKGSAKRQFHLRATGADSSIGGNMPIAAEDLASLLNRARELWLDGAPGRRAAETSTSSPKRNWRGVFYTYYVVVLTGRIDRRTYWIGMAITVGLMGLVAALSRWNLGSTNTLGLLMGWFLIGGRLRDLGRSPYQRLLFIPLAVFASVSSVWLGLGPQNANLVLYLASFIVALALGTPRGDPSANAYGLPLAGEAPVDQVFE